MFCNLTGGYLLRKSLLILTVGAAILAPAGQTGEKATTTADKMKQSTTVLRFFDAHQWLLAPRKEKCSQVPWKKQCLIARKLVKHHTTRVVKLKREIWYALPHTNDWRTSVRIAQRPYPGTDAWLLFISKREGGYGGFVMNHQGSGAGGWMQFMSGTFYGYVGAAQADLRQRGFNIPDNVMVWTHPLGQALTAGYMRYYGKDGCHWCL